ncbi:MAG: single-stranded DNA-binding protein [Proteobacteria bacterium]|jgi:single-strand DNA-binding protein|nr:single-stranded DNA-binding protein [Pseudomonadota bacterium]
MKKIIITGNLGRDPEMRSDQKGGQFATFALAVSIGTKQNPKTDWVDISCNGKLAEIICTYAKKGTKVLVSGFPSVNAYINKENVAVGVLRVYADDIEFLSSKPSSDNASTDDVHSLPPLGMSSANGILESDDIPF